MHLVKYVGGGSTSWPHHSTPDPSITSSTAKLTLEPTGAHQIILRVPFLDDISASLVYWKTPVNHVTNSYLELAGRVLHNVFMDQ